MPTSHSAPVFSNPVAPGSNDFVWLYANGTHKGLGVVPLQPVCSVPAWLMGFVQTVADNKTPFRWLWQRMQIAEIAAALEDLKCRVVLQMSGLLAHTEIRQCVAQYCAAKNSLSNGQTTA